MQPIILYGRMRDYSYLEIALLLQVLSLPHEKRAIEEGSLMHQQYVRCLYLYAGQHAPLVIDENNSIVLFDTGAIVSYLTTKYDNDRRISFDMNSHWYCVSNQYHTVQIRFMERLASGIDIQTRGYDCTQYFDQEIYKGLHVLNRILTQNMFPGEGRGMWMMENKLTYVDLSFWCWHTCACTISSRALDLQEFPIISQWLQGIQALDFMDDIVWFFDTRRPLPRLTNGNTFADMRDNTSGDMRGDTSGDMRDDMRDDTSGDMRDDTSGDMRDDMRDDTSGDTRDDMRDDTSGDMRDDMRGDTSGDTRDDMRDDTSGDMRDDMRGDTSSVTSDR
ncbi:hypothetical protein F4803DRAFT_556004 [Xylaria telfairii]|nr:hypothetical protein F4803DRAFT_556004 [Xylaria telfairii]